MIRRIQVLEVEAWAHSGSEACFRNGVVAWAHSDLEEAVHSSLVYRLVVLVECRLDVPSEVGTVVIWVIVASLESLV